MGERGYCRYFQAKQKEPPEGGPYLCKIFQQKHWWRAFTYDVTLRTTIKNLRGLLVRCNDVEFKNKHVSYTDVIMCEEWYNLQAFCSWCEKTKPCINNIKWELDKDLLGDGKLYSQDTCCFLPKDVNLFLSKLDRTYIPRCSNGRWQVWCSDGINLDNRYVGSYTTREEALDVWRQKKNARLLSLIEKYKCVLPRHVSDALYGLIK